MKARLFALLIIVGLASGVALAQSVPTISTPLVSSTAASGQSGYIAINGQGTCGITSFVSTGTATITVYGENDSVPTYASTWVANSNFGASGQFTSTTTPSIVGGNVAAYSKGFYFTWSGNSGTITAIGTCSGASGSIVAGTITVASMPPAVITAPTDAAGRLSVDLNSTPLPVTTINPSLPAPQATFPVSCTAAANCPVNATQVTSPWIVSTPTAAPLPTASAGAALPANPVSVSGGQCFYTASASVAITNLNGYVPRCDIYGVQAQGICSATACSPAIGDTPFYSTVTTSLATVIALTSGGQKIHITSIGAIVEESATGGYLTISFGTGTNCGTTNNNAAVLAYAGTSAGLVPATTFGSGVGSVIIGAANTEMCAVVSAGTVVVAAVYGTYTVY